MAGPVATRRCCRRGPPRGDDPRRVARVARAERAVPRRARRVGLPVGPAVGDVAGLARRLRAAATRRCSSGSSRGRRTRSRRGTASCSRVTSSTPHGINLLANTSVLALGVPLAPVTWLGGPVLTQNVALLLAVPVAVVAMDLLPAPGHDVGGRARRPVAPLRLLAVRGREPRGQPPHDRLDRRPPADRARRRSTRSTTTAAARAAGRCSWACALVVQFFVSTELLLLERASSRRSSSSSWAITAAVDRRVPRARAARRAPARTAARDRRGRPRRSRRPTPCGARGASRATSGARASTPTPAARPSSTSSDPTSSPRG